MVTLIAKIIILMATLIKALKVTITTQIEAKPQMEKTIMLTIRQTANQINLLVKARLITLLMTDQTTN